MKAFDSAEKSVRNSSCSTTTSSRMSNARSRHAAIPRRILVFLLVACTVTGSMAQSRNGSQTSTVDTIADTASTDNPDYNNDTMTTFGPQIAYSSDSSVGGRVPTTTAGETLPDVTVEDTVPCPVNCKCLRPEDTARVLINCSVDTESDGKQLLYGDITRVDVNLNDLPAIPDLCSFSQASHVTIIEGELVDLSLDPFLCLEQLRELHVRDGKTEHIDLSAARLLNLDVIDVSGNGISEIAISVQFDWGNETDRASWEPALNRLNLSRNQIRTLKRGIFGNVQALDLSHNLVGSLEDVLVGVVVGNLTKLDLSFNSVRRLDGAVLHGAHNLVKLDLSHNEIADIDPGLFSCQVPNLRSLNLAFNRLSDLQDYAFSGLHKLRSLDLSHNSLSLLNGTAFDDDPFTVCDWPPDAETNSSQHLSGGPRPWQHFDTLDLSHNNISSVDQSTFRGSLLNLRTLLLGNNRIRHLPKYGIESLKRLEWVDLQANQIDWLDVGTFTNAKLRHINLAHNQLKKVISMAFLFLPKIQSIDLSHNHINYLYKYAFYRICKQLHTLEISLRGNDLAGDVIWKLWQTFRHLEQTGCSVRIDLHRNQIEHFFEDSSLETIQKHFAQQDVPYFFSWDYLKIDLGNNPIACDCVLYSEVQTLDTISKSFKRSLTYPENIDFWKSANCSSPVILQDLTIQQSLPMLNCPEVKDCPMLCDCFHQTLYDDIYVNCSNRNLNLFPSVLPSGPKALNFHGNMLTVIPMGFNLANVTYLDLSDNHLTVINTSTWEHMTGMVKTVLLGNNQLTDLPGPPKGSLGSEKITLAGNPFSCKCGSQWMSSWVMKNTHVIADAKTITCADGRRVTQLLKEDFGCGWHGPHAPLEGDTHPSTLNVPGLVLAGVLFVLGLLIALLLAFRSRIRGAILAKSKWYKVHIEQEKKYDVFFMLHHSDAMWTERAIVSRLLTDSQHSHRVYLPSQLHSHAFALEQLQSGVENSKCVVMIVSRAFVTQQLSDGSYLEVVREMLRADKHQVYVVFLDNARPGDLSPEMHELLRGKMWFQHEDDGDEMFVERLLQQLPQPGCHSIETATTSRTGLIHYDLAEDMTEDPLGNI